MKKTKRCHIPELIRATLSRDSTAIRDAIAAGADVNEVDRDGRTALHHAAINGDISAVALLMEAGAQPNIRDSAGWTALHFAAAEYHMPVAEALLRAGAVVDAEDGHGNTPLFRAVFESRGRGEMIRLLRAHGADAAHVNRHGVSPAGLAATIANYDVGKWLE
jgi:uncharacterized protein